MEKQSTIKLHKPVNEGWDKINRGYISIMNQANNLNKKIKALDFESLYKLDKQKNKEVATSLDKFEKVYTSWKKEATDLLVNPKLSFPENCNINLSFSHCKHTLYLMLSETAQAYNSVLRDYSTVNSKVKSRFTKLASSISISLAVISIVIALVA